MRLRVIGDFTFYALLRDDDKADLVMGVNDKIILIKEGFANLAAVEDSVAVLSDDALLSAALRAVIEREGSASHGSR